MQFVLARKGSEFGSAFTSDLIDNGDMLCWTDTNNNLSVELPYLSRTDTKDNTRGEPTWEKLTDEESELQLYLQGCGITDETVLKQQTEYWQAIRETPLVAAALKAADKDSNGKVDENEFKGYFHFAVAARPGGIRSGDMSSNRLAKSKNVTETSSSYYLPTISENSGTDDDVIIDNYLGNNGRLEIANQMLHVTKTVEMPVGTTIPSGEEFNYQIFVQGVTGKRTAIQTQYNEYSDTWERRLAYIDVLTDNSGLVTYSDSIRALFNVVTDGETTTARMVVYGSDGLYYANDDGTITEEPCNTAENMLYYLYLPSSGTTDTGSQHVRRLYQDPEYNKEDKIDTANLKNGTTTIETADPTNDLPAGTKTYWATDAELIPVQEVLNAEKGSGEPVAVSTSIWEHTSDGHSGHTALTSHTFFIRKPNSETSESYFASPYKTRTMYMTTELNFGVNANKGDGSAESGSLTGDDLYDQTIPSDDRPDLFGSLSKEQIAASTAEFTLKHGEGLLLTGLQNRVAYRFTEKLTEEQMNKGYTLQEVSHIQQRGSESIYRPGVQQVPVYTAPGATYGSNYPEPEEQIENGLTWPTNPSATVSYEPFAHTNAIMWEYYATMGSDELGNHHHPESAGSETADFYRQDENTHTKQTVLANPSCSDSRVDVAQPDGSIRHYMYRDGELVDPHYDGEASSYLRNMARYLVSPTVHFAVTDEPDTTKVPSTSSEDYTGVYSVFGNTGWFEEQAHFVNTYKPTKTEITPGADKPVQIGDEITYEISYYNITADTAPVIIVDRLDPGVDFVRATDEGFYRYFVEDGNVEYQVVGGAGVIKVPAHTVVWVMKDVAPNAGGTVTLTVRVNENAKKLWQYGDDYLDAPEQDPEKNDFEVVDKAGVQVGNGPMLYTDQVENPVTEKIEPNPGDGEPVEVGQPVNYEISWRNTKDVSQKIIVTDWLDDGVDFASASFRGVQLTKEGTTATGFVPNGEGKTQVITIEYDKKDHKVTWTIENAEPGEFGTVNLNVTVNANAVKKWSYPDKSGDGTGVDNKTDYKIINRAEVQIGNDSEVTKQVENPLQEKTEITPGDGKQVLVGDPNKKDDFDGDADEDNLDKDSIIKYEILYHNDTSKMANITIMDKLDPGVTFVSASDGGMYYDKDGWSLVSDEKIPGHGEAIPGHSVVWVLYNVEPGARGTVTLTVQVNERAFEYWQYEDGSGTLTGDPGKDDYEVVNKAGIKVGNEDWHYTNVVENPIPEKTETDPGAGKVVAVGQEVKYEISWRNATDTDQTVKVEDWLDTGVDFVSAKFGGVQLTEGKTTATGRVRNSAGNIQDIMIEYDKTAHKVTWIIDKVTPGEIGTVYLTVRVNEKAVEEWSYSSDQGGGTPGDSQDCEIINRAEVSIGNDHKVTPEVKNPVLEKKEDTPGSGKQVQVGDTVSYTITWNNYETETANVTVRDMLDPGVDFVNASFHGSTLTAYDFNDDTNVYTVSTDTELVSGINSHVTITYDVFGRQITWEITNVPAGYCGMVYFSVKVNEKADAGHSYNDYGNIPSYPVGEDDYRILNQGGVTVGHNPEYYTNIIKNPTSPTYQPKVSKSVVGNPNTTQTFTFALNENQDDPYVVLKDTKTVTIIDEDEAFFDEIIFSEEGTYNFTIQEIVPDPIPTGFTYDTSKWTLTVIVSEENGRLTATGTYSKLGEPLTETSATEATFINKYETGNLSVTKTVEGDGDRTKEWHFTVELSDKTISGKYGDMMFTDGKATFTLKHDESATATGLPAGITYTVTETEADQDGYETSMTGDTGTIHKDDTAKADFVNTKNPPPPPEEHYGSLTVRKTVTGDGDRNKDWNFTVELSDKTINGTLGDMTFANGVAKFTLKHGESLTATDLPAGITYTVTETEANEGGYTTTPEGETGTIPENDTAEAKFVNDKPTPPPPGGNFGNLTVTKTVTGEGDTSKDWNFAVTLSDTSVNGTYGDMTFTNGVATFTLKHGESSTARNLPAGVTYTVTEAEANADGYTTTQTGETGTIPENGTAEAKFVNDKPTPPPPPEEQVGNLTVSKNVTGEGDTSKQWYFRVELSEPLTGQYGDMRFVDGVASFTLRHGESITASGLPVGITYTVTEEEANQGGYVTEEHFTEGTITAGTIEAWFINDLPDTDTGSLTVTKTVTGEAGDTEKDWHFTVTLDDDTVNGWYGDMYFRNGVATFTLKHGESLTATDLPAGIGYTVTEDEAGEDGYTTSGSGITGAIPGGSTATAHYENRKDEPDTGNLTVTKVVTGAGDTEKLWHITVTLDDPTVDGVYGGMTFHNGVASFTLRHGETVTATGLPADAWYTVSEAEANTDGYETAEYGTVGTIPESGTADAVFENDLPEPGGLTVTKTVEGEDADTTKEWHFTVTLSDTTINGTYGGMTFTNGVASFTLKHGESLTATGLPADITYSVSEAEANTDGYTTTATGETGTITADAEARAEFVNSMETGALTVSKILEGESADPNKDWTFTVTLSDTSINGTYGGMTFVNGVATFTLKGGQTVTATGLPAGVTYTVTEAEANTDGYVTTSTGETGTISEDGAAAVFTNTIGVGDLTVGKILEGEGADPNKDWTFTVTLSDSTINGTYGAMTFVNGVATFTLKGGQTITATGLPAGITYTVTEAEANTDGYKTTSIGETGEIPLEGSAAAVFTNTIGVGDLTVSKILEGEGADPNKDWTFTVTLSDSTINGTYGGMTFTNGVATFTLKGGESLTATGLPAGVTYTVTEAEANTDGYKTTSTGASGEITEGGNAQAVFTNSINTGALTVSKILEGEGADPNKDWTFTVTLSDSTINGTYGGMTFTNGVATFTLKGGQTLTATGLPAGITYTVTEAEANTDGYKTTSIGETGEIPLEGSADAVFTNSIDTGALTVSKILEGESADPNKDWTFTVTLSDPTINGTYGGMTFVNGVATFTLKGGERLTATGLPVGISYTVTEAEANTDGYKTTSTGETGEIPAEGSAEAVFTNSIEEGALTVVKNIEGKEADPNKDWTFTVTLSDSTINGTYGGMTFVNGVATFTLKGGERLTATGLPAGITYTVTEAEANTDGYTTRTAGTTGTIPADGEAVATFVNSKGEVEKGNFAVRKRVRGEDADPNQVFHFIITLSDPTIGGTFGDVTFENGVGQVALKDGEHAWILGLPVGTTYTVTEVEANQDGYQTRGEGETGAVPATGHNEARFTNFRGPGEPNWDEPWEELPDPEVPLAPPEDNPSDNPPQTNDQSNRELWMLMMAAAFLGMTAQFLPGKRKEEA